MGICCSLPVVCGADSSVRKIALKLPHGSKGVFMSANQFQDTDINEWVANLYNQKTWTGWFCYNDDLPGEDQHTSRGHCKGIVTWNESRIGWLIHSVPKFPQSFNGSYITPIGASELIYGQSFLYIEQSRSKVNLDDVIRQIFWMKPNLFHTHNMPTVALYNPLVLEIKTLKWSKTMTHLAKSPEHNTDFIGTELCKLHEGWHEETWKRGSLYQDHKNVKTIHTLCVNNTSYTSSQDHSKWAVSPSHVWIGDLNHMKSQEKRGGGGMVINNKEVASAFSALVKVHN
jgi:hypothetical protein